MTTLRDRDATASCMRDFLRLYRAYRYGGAPARIVALVSGAKELISLQGQNDAVAAHPLPQASSIRRQVDQLLAEARQTYEAIQQVEGKDPRT